MTKSIPTSWRVSQKARGTIMLRVGAAILVAISLMIAVSAVLAKPLPPNAPNGAIVHACPDAYDAIPSHDDLQANASTLTAGPSQLHNFDGNTLLGVADKDWARFQVVQDGVYTLATTIPNGQTTDTFIKLFDANGSPVLSGGAPVENNNAAGLGAGSRIVWTAPSTASGWYYLSIYPTGTAATTYANCAGVVVSYTLSLQSKEPKFIFLPLITKDYSATTP